MIYLNNNTYANNSICIFSKYGTKMNRRKGSLLLYSSVRLYGYFYTNFISFILSLYFCGTILSRSHLISSNAFMIVALLEKAW